MFGIRFDTLLPQLVDAFLDRSYESKTLIEAEDYQNSAVAEPGLLFSLRLNLSNYEDDYTFSYTQNIFILFCGNTSVFTAEINSHLNKPEDIPNDVWENPSNHDSCWRSDGIYIFSKIYFDMAEKINADRVAAGLEKIAPVKMDEFCQLRDFFKQGLYEPTRRRPFKQVIVTHRRIRGENYKREILSID